ncbi:MAG: hypothetical protein JWR09_3465 [Mucilaginibacter sp.]|nr:hypothetical protein [Mucilaginibacter sp.]
MAEAGKRKAKRMAAPKRAVLQSSGVKVKARLKGLGFNVPPEAAFVAICFDQQGQAPEAERFYRHYQNE